jgi:spermidine/putrescine transport system substrate-binding protein
MNKITKASMAVAILTLPLLVVCGIIVASCDSGTKEVATLNVYNWADYLAPTAPEDFEREYGIKVNLMTYNDEEEMLAAVQSNPGKYDVVFPGDELLYRMIMLKLLSPLDHTNLPNLKNMDTRFLDLSYDPGNIYSTPYSYGFTGIAYNTKYITEPVDSWGILWDERYQGHIAMLNNLYTDIGLTLKYLGYSVSSKNTDELEQARLKLLEQKHLIVGYLDPTTIVKKLASEEIWLAMCYNGDAIYAAENNPNIRLALPKEGADLWMDFVAIPRDALHKQAAELFINYLMRPDVQASFCNCYGYACLNRAAIDAGLIDPEDLNNPAIYPPTDKLEPFQYTGGANRLYQQIWAEIRR